MPDSPDYEKYRPNSTRFSLQDMGELAARLGSPHNFDRRGEFEHIEDFSYGLNGWTGVTFGTGALVDIAAGIGIDKPYVLRLRSGTTSFKSAGVSKVIGTNQFGRLGCEYVLSSNDIGDIIDLSMNIYDGLFLYQSKIRYEYGTQQLQVMQSDLTFATVADVLAYTTDGIYFTPIKWVIDTNVNRYIRVRFANTEYDLSAYEMRKTSDVHSPSTEMAINTVGLATGTIDTYVAHILLTSNEP